MSEGFDPYYEWLGIPPKDQPPHHYRLLGLEPFEANVNVIERAADRQMGHVRTFQSGQHSKASQELLNKLSAAKVCLLNAQKKAEYDAALRKTLTSAAASSSVSFDRLRPNSPRRSRPANRIALVVISAAAVLVVVIAASLFLPDRGTAPQISTARPPTAPTNPRLPAAGPRQPAQGSKTPPVAAPSAMNSPLLPSGKGNSQSVLPSPEAEESKPEPSPPPKKRERNARKRAAAAGLPSINEAEDQPEDPPPAVSWASPDAVLREKFEAAKGILQEQFAFCQSMSLPDFIEAALQLRELGYRPTRARPYGVTGTVQVAAIWARDGLPWRLVAGVSRPDIVRAHAKLEQAGFTPVDLWGSARPAQTYTGLWVKLDRTIPARLAICQSKEESDQFQAESRELGFTPRSAQWLALDGRPLSYSFIFLKGSSKRNWNLFVGTPPYFANQIARGLPTDVGHFESGEGIRLSGVVLMEDQRKFAESHGGTVDEHLKSCADFARRGLIPLSISVCRRSEDGRLEAASIWGERELGLLPEIRDQPST